MSTATRPIDAARKIHHALSALIEPCLSLPAHLDITIIGNQDFPVFQIQVHRADMGRMVGKGGANLTALKALLKAMAAGQHLACGLILSDPEPSPGLRPAGRWSIKACEEAIRSLLDAAGLPSPVAIVPGRPGQHLVMIGTEIPEDIEGPLSRWLNPMGVEGQTRLLFDDTTEPV